MINQNIIRELEKKRKGHILFNYQIPLDLYRLPEMIQDDIVVNLSVAEWMQVSSIVLLKEKDGKWIAGDKDYIIEVARKYIATKLLVELEKKYPQIKEYGGSEFLPIFLKNDREEYQRKRNYIYGLKDVEDILEVEGIPLDRVHFIMNGTRSNNLCDALSILLSDDTPFNVSIYCSPNGFLTYYIPDSKDRIVLENAYNFTVYNKRKEGYFNKAKKSKEKKKNTMEQ